MSGRRRSLEFRCGKAGCYGQVAEFRPAERAFELVLYQREPTLVVEDGQDFVRAMLEGNNVKRRRRDPERTPVSLSLDQLAERVSAESWIITPNCPKCGTTLDMRPLDPTVIEVYRDPSKPAVILKPVAS